MSGLAGVAARRQRRKLEAMRDSLLEKSQKARADLAKVRAEMKVTRRTTRGKS